MIPIAYRPTKLILVGDPIGEHRYVYKKSGAADSSSHGRSMFERMRSVLKTEGTMCRVINACINYVFVQFLGLVWILISVLVFLTFCCRISASFSSNTVQIESVVVQISIDQFLSGRSDYISVSY